MQPHGGVCMMFGCSNHRKMKNGPSFYRFPKNKEICLKWVEKCKRDDLRGIFAEKGPEYISKNHSLCSDHFTTKDFRNNNKPTQGVCPGAVPSVKIHGQEDGPEVINSNAIMKIKLKCPSYLSSPSPSPSPESSPCQSPVLSKRKTVKTKKPAMRPKTEMVETEVESINQQEVVGNKTINVEMKIEERPSTSPDPSQPNVKPTKLADKVKSLKRIKPTSLEDYKEMLKKSRQLVSKYRVRCKTYKNKIQRMKKKIESKKQEKL